jgi:hypothetical protein
MTRTFFWKLTVKAVILLALAGPEVACGPEDTQGVVFRVELVYAPNLIKNGSFEDRTTFVSTPDEPIVAPGAKILCGGSGALSNWSVARLGAAHQDCTPAQTGGASNTVSWFNSPNQAGITAADGRMFINLLGFPRPGLGVIEQTKIPTKPGYVYSLWYYIGNTTAFYTQGTTTQTGIRVQIVDEETNHEIQQDEKDAPFPPNNVSEWEPKNTQFTAMGSQTTVRFTAVGTGGGATFVGLDNVSLHCFQNPSGFIFIGGC